VKKRKRGAQPGNRNARKHGFYSPTLSPEEISLVWNTVNLKGMDPVVAVIRIKLALALQRDPANHRLLEDAAKLLTKLGLTGFHVDEFDRRQFRAAILNALEVSQRPSPTSTEQSDAGRAQTVSRSQSFLITHKSRRRTNRACQARMAKQNESNVL
jgi:hypothetical protein